jgi:hypothetical protein
MVTATPQFLARLEAQYCQAIIILRTKTDAPLSTTDCEPTRLLVRCLLDEVVATDFLKHLKGAATEVKCDVFTTHRSSVRMATVMRKMSEFGELGHDTTITDEMKYLVLGEKQRLQSVRRLKGLWMEVQRIKAEHQ